MTAQVTATLKTWALPALVLLGLVAGWELLVRLAGIPAYTLPAPSLVAQTLGANFGSLAGSWWVTVKITLGALALACAGGVLIAAAFALSPTLERCSRWRWCCRSRPSWRWRH